MRNQFGMEACMESVEFSVEFWHENPFEMLGRYMIRKAQDPFFNSTMIDAVEKYIKDHNIRWDARIEK